MPCLDDQRLVPTEDIEMKACASVKPLRRARASVSLDRHDLDRRLASSADGPSAVRVAAG